MSSSYGRKQPLGQKVKGALRRAFTFAVLGGVFVGAPAYYEYGTIHTEEVKVREVKNVWDHYDDSKGESVYKYQLVTSNGQTLENKNTLLHFKFNSKDIQDQVNAGRDEYNNQDNNNYDNSFSIWGDSNPTPPKPKDPKADPANKVWRIEYYGARIDVPFIHTYPNVLSVQEITPDELAARAKAAQQAAHDKAAQIKQDQQQGQQATKPQGQQQPQQAAALSGTTVTFETVVDGERVTITAPIEAAGKVQVTKVAPLVPKGPGS